jgi:lipoate-protein ligase A
MDGTVIFDQPRSGAENMAIDDAMLQWCDDQHAIALRIYRWAKPTLSLGYFQPWEQWLSYRDREPTTSIDLSLACDSSDGTTAEVSRSNGPKRVISPFEASQIEVVRRRTGGGAIMHHHDWTYSLVVPWDQVRLGPTRQLYQWIHHGLVDWLNRFGFLAYLQSASEPVSKSAPFLCFHRRTEGDILVGTDKVIGSAQRRGKQSLLQHGSVLLAQSRYAPSLPGLAELVDNREQDSNSPLTTIYPDSMYSFGRSIQESTSRQFDVTWQESNNIESFGIETIHENVALHQSSTWLERV